MKRLLILAIAIASPAMAQTPAGETPESRQVPAEVETDVGPTAPRIILESNPRSVRRSLDRQAKSLEKAVRDMPQTPYAVVVAGYRRWSPGRVVRIAFDGGSPARHAQIESIAQRWTGPGRANLILSFRDDGGNFRKWTANDSQYSAEIRITFAGAGYRSMVGLDSIDSHLIGGLPSEPSMVLGGFDQALPWDWEVTVLHEFGHALGFQHEHQNPDAGCDFRFEDETGYRRKKDKDGWYTLDRNGRRPGLYTYLGGYSNYWEKSDVDANLRALEDSSAYERTAFDSVSIMKYQLPAFLFYADDRSPCFTGTQTAELSALDLQGVRAAYPADLADIQTVSVGQEALLNAIKTAKGADKNLIESVDRRLISLGFR